jgi:hypothetical protein
MGLSTKLALIVPFMLLCIIGASICVSLEELQFFGISWFIYGFFGTIGSAIHAASTERSDKSDREVTVMSFLAGCFVLIGLGLLLFA